MLTEKITAQTEIVNTRLLIVEDNEADAVMLFRELDKAAFSYSSLVVQTKKDYLNALETFSPDIIISDFSLPSFSAVAAFEIQQKNLAHIPFIIVSGIIGEENVADLIKKGVTDYIPKDKLFTIYSKIKRALKETAERKEKQLIDEKLKNQTAELIVANYELALKNKEKEKHTAELIKANIELKNAQENLKEYTKGLEEMMFMTSHKIRVPITNIMGVSELLNRSLDSPEKIKTSVAFIQKSAIILDNYTRELAAFMQVLESKGKFKNGF